jgi:hypothetical protein
VKDIADDSTYGLLVCNGSRSGGWSAPRSKEGMRKDKVELAFKGGYADAASFLLARTFTGHLRDAEATCSSFQVLNRSSIS